MKKMNRIALGFAAAAAVAVGCVRDNTNQVYETDSLKLPAQTLNYQLPSKAEANGVVFVDNPTNPISNDAATLGRVLFYDKKLSLNNQVACASCHHQQTAFADNVSFSEGFNGQKTTRNASSIANPVLEKALFWDMRSPSLEDLALRPVRNHIEMGIEDMDKLSVKLAKISYYQPLFQKAFGTADINGDRIAKAVGQFLRSMVTYQSKFDAGKNNKFASFTAQELRGKDLFMTKLHCNNCHGGDNFNTSIDGEAAHNIGLDKDYADNGVGSLKADASKTGFFKVPSLRNVGLTAPYMHDGRFATLEQVVEHYDHNLQPHVNLFPNLRTFLWEGNGGGVNSGGSTGWSTGGTTVTNGSTTSSFARPNNRNLLPNDKTALVAFLKTLSDVSLTTDARFSNPFKN